MKRSVAEAVPPEPDHNGVPRTIAESIYRRLRQDILWCRFAPGAPLRSDQLRARYGVGISPLREALTRLASERLVTAVGQRGFRVAPLTAYDVEDTMATRLVIEGEALTRSIERGDIVWETSVVAAFHALSRNPIPTPGQSTEVWAVAHRRFHLALLSACGSRWHMQLADLLFDQAERHRILRS
jgi:DNA-binding GntR family transcriptional regulator